MTVTCISRDKVCMKSMRFLLNLPSAALKANTITITPLMQFNFNALKPIMYNIILNNLTFLHLLTIADAASPFPMFGKKLSVA